MSLQKFENTSFATSSKKGSRLLASTDYQGLNLSGLVVTKEEKKPTVDELVNEKLKTEKQKMAADAEKMTALASQLSMALSSFNTESLEYFNKVKKEATTMAIEVARKLIGEELKTNPALVEGSINALLDEVSASQKKALEINSADWAFLSEAKPDVVTALKSVEALEIRTLDTIPSGVVRLVMENQVLETGAVKKIDHLWQELLGKGYVKE
ncbi:flagellar assembly protein FliH [bacterium]|nr:flagellar assembly protein FliH [bacterium]